MILYSIMPPEVVFNLSVGSEEISCLEADYRGERVMVAKMGDNQYSITRLLSTNPGLFLDPAFQPGSVVSESELHIKR